MLTEVAEGRLPIGQTYVRASSAAPARAFGLYPRKGVLAAGADADIAVVDLNKPRHQVSRPAAAFPQQASRRSRGGPRGARR